MGLRALFGKGPLSEKKITKLAKLAANPFAQPDIRMREMQRLLDDDSAAAIRGVLKRFASNASGHIADEDEKKWLEDALVDKGEISLEPLRAYLREEKQLTYALRAYRRLTDDEEAVRFFLEILQRYGPEHHRSGEAKLQIVWQLSENLDFPTVLPGLLPFLEDHSDDIRWAVLDIIERIAEEGGLSDAHIEQAVEHLGELLSNASTGPRIQKRAAELVHKQTWILPSPHTEIAPLLQEDYFVDKKNYLRKRAKR